MTKLFGLMAVGLLVSSPLAVNGAVLVSGNITSTGGSFAITEDITLSITGTGGVSGLIFDEWVSSNDGNNTSLSFSSATLQYQINGGGLQSVGLNALRDNLATTINDVTPNDGYVQFNTISVNPGDTLTLKVGSWSVSGSSAFNPQAVQNFTGNVFAYTGSGVRISTDSVVPEPREYGMLAGAGLLGLAIWRRQKAALAR